MQSSLHSWDPMKKRLFANDCLQMTQPTDKPASRSSPTVLVLSSTCLHCTVADALLGMLVSLLDSISSDFVFGPIGTEGRPAGALSIEMLNKLDVGQLLSCAERHRPHQVLSVWHSWLAPIRFASDCSRAETLVVWMWAVPDGSCWCPCTANRRLHLSVLSCAWLWPS